MKPIERILVSVDLSDRSVPVLQEGARLAAVTGAKEVLVLHVVHDLDSMIGVYLTEKPIPQLQREMEIEGTARLRELFREHFDEQIPAKDLVKTGVPWSEVVGCALHHQVDLIVLGAHTQNRPEHKVLGSTVQRVLRHAPCSVVVVPPE